MFFAHKILITSLTINKFYKLMDVFLSKQSHDFVQGQGRAIFLMYPLIILHLL